MYAKIHPFLFTADTTPEKTLESLFTNPLFFHPELTATLLPENNNLKGITKASNNKRKVQDTNYESKNIKDQLRTNPKLDGKRHAVDVLEYVDRYEIITELPGYKKENIDIDFEDATNKITLKGNNSSSSFTDKNKNGDTSVEKPIQVLSERAVNTSFKRSFKLKKEVDAGNIDAKFVNGILTVTIPILPKSTNSYKISIV